MTTSDFVKKRGLLFFAVTLGAGMIFLDMTILPVALPTIQKEYPISSVTLQWILNVYLIVNSAFILTGGKLGDRYGHRRLFCLGISLFAFASMLGGFAKGALTLIGSRTLQGFGAALMGPAISALLIESYPIQKRGRMVGLMVSIGALFVAFGPLVGGFLTDYFSWRFIFWINIPFSIVAVWLAMVAVNRSPKHKKKICFWGMLIFFLMSGSLIAYLLEAQNWGFGHLSSLYFLFAFALLLILFILHQKYASAPFFDTKLFLSRHYLGSIVIIFVAQLFFLITVFWPIFYQETFGYSATEAGLFITYSTIPILIFAPIGGFLLDKFGPRLPITLGAILICFSFIWFHFNQADAKLDTLMPGLLPFGIGITFIFNPSATTASNVAGPEKRGVGSGMFNTARNLGAAIAIPLIGALINYFSKTSTAKTDHLAMIDAYAKVDIFCIIAAVFVCVYALIVYKGYSKNSYK